MHETSSLFRPLPVVLRFLRLEWGQTEKDLDRLLHLPKGSYERYERGEAQPSLDALSAILEHFNLDLGDLDRRMKSLVGVRWPHPVFTRAQRERFSSASDLRRASETIRDLEFPHTAAPRTEKGFDSCAEAIRWLREILCFTESELANLVAEEEATIRALEAGKREPTEDERMRIARFIQPRFNKFLAAVGARGVPPCWNPPRL